MYGGAKSALVAPRPMLHARRLTLIHPGSGEEMSFEATLPADMEAIIAKCSFEIPEK
jgi:23S rRNA pseudouridine1911/1915/1917 synthase